MVRWIQPIGSSTALTTLLDLRNTIGDLIELAYHVQFLHSDYKQRQQKNNRYSLRAYAYRLGLHPSALSRILAGKQELSVKACMDLVPSIEMTEELKRMFLISVADERRRRTIARFEMIFEIKLD